MAELTVQISASNQDGNIFFGTSFGTNQNTIRVGEDNSNNPYSGYFHFTLTGIQQGATIDAATITLVGANAGAGPSATFIIAASDEDDAAIPTSYSDFTGRARTTATVTVSAETSSAGSNHEYNIQPIVQEVVDRAGFPEGGDLLVFFDGDTVATGNNDRVEFDSWDGDSAEAAELNVTYTNPGGTLTVDDMASDTVMDEPAITQTHVLTVDDMASDTAMDEPAIAQTHVLTIDDMASDTVMDEPAIAQTHVLTIDDMASDTVMDEPAITTGGTLTVDDMASDTVMDEPAITQTHVLTVDDMASDTVMDEPAITTGGTLTIDDMASDTVMDEPAITQTHVLTIDDMASDTVMDEPSLSAPVQITVDDMASDTAMDEPAITQTHVLTVDDMASIVVAEAIAIIQTHVLTVDDMASDTAMDEPSLSEAEGVLEMSVSNATPTLTVTVIDLPTLNVKIVEN